jgi:hypothetical protein
MLDREMLEQRDVGQREGKEERRKKLNYVYYRKALISLVRKGKQPLQHK